MGPQILVASAPNTPGVASRLIQSHAASLMSEFLVIVDRAQARPDQELCVSPNVSSNTPWSFHALPIRFLLQTGRLGRSPPKMPLKPPSVMTARTSQSQRSSPVNFSAEENAFWKFATVDYKKRRAESERYVSGRVWVQTLLSLSLFLCLSSARATHYSPFTTDHPPRFAFISFA